jgi:hypothetical protein
MPRTVLYSLGFSAICAGSVALVFTLLSWAGSSVPGYLASHTAIVWLMSASLFTALWAHLGMLEYGRRDARARAATWRTARTARTARSSASGLTGAYGAAAACRRCPGLREENAALRMRLEAAQREALVLGEQTTREAT